MALRGGRSRRARGGLRVRRTCDHAFVDGTKRVALVAMTAFLRLNGILFQPDRAHATAAVIGLAAGEIDELGLTRWIRDNGPAA